MKIVIEISSYDKEWITNGYHIPEEINTKISEAIANGIPIPEIYKMRKATPKERESLNNYITSISHTTCVDFWDEIKEATADADSD